jgi:hypothetical protein
VKQLVAIWTFHEQGTDSPYLVAFAAADAVQQLHGHTVVEQLVPDFQVGRSRKLCVSGLLGHREFHGFVSFSSGVTAEFLENQSLSREQCKDPVESHEKSL